MYLDYAVTYLPGLYPGLSNERCCSQRRGGTLCNCVVLRTTPFTANLLEPLQQNAALCRYDYPQCMA